MRWLVRLVCRKGGVVIDPFAGTGTTGAAAYWEGSNAILCEREPEFQADITKRMGLVLAGPDEKKRARTEPAPASGLPLFSSL
jgi:site-specific DNA-methyltransferase (adenine-specific)